MRRRRGGSGVGAGVEGSVAVCRRRVWTDTQGCLARQGVTPRLVVSGLVGLSGRAAVELAGWCSGAAVGRLWGGRELAGWTVHTQGLPRDAFSLDFKRGSAKSKGSAWSPERAPAHPVPGVARPDTHAWGGSIETGGPRLALPPPHRACLPACLPACNAGGAHTCHASDTTCAAHTQSCMCAPDVG